MSDTDRNSILEEAAWVADDFARDDRTIRDFDARQVSEEIASRIRALKSDEAPAPTKEFLVGDRPYCWACVHKKHPYLVEFLYHAGFVDETPRRPGWTVTPLYTRPVPVSDMDHATVSPAASDGAVNDPWLPIESAPTNGVRVDLWSAENGRIADAIFVDGEWRYWVGEGSEGLDWVKVPGGITHWRLEPPPPGSGDRETAPNGTPSHEPSLDTAPTLTDADVERAAEAIRAEMKRSHGGVVYDGGQEMRVDRVITHNGFLSIARAALSSLHAKGDK